MVSGDDIMGELRMIREEQHLIRLDIQQLRQDLTRLQDAQNQEIAQARRLVIANKKKSNRSPGWLSPSLSALRP